MTKQLTVTKVEQGSYSGFGSRREVVVTNAADWATFWKQHHSRVFPVPALPTIDFSKEMVIAVFMGQRSSGGFSTTIEKVVDGAKNVVVTYREKSPSGMSTAAMSQPFHIVRVPASTKPVVFKVAK